MHARTVSLIAVLLLALAPVSAEASRKLSVSSLDVPATGQRGAPLEISGRVRNGGDEKARATVRAYLADTLGQIRIGGRQLGWAQIVSASSRSSPALPEGTPDGDYEIVVCARRLNRDGAVRCRSAPLSRSTASAASCRASAGACGCCEPISAAARC